MKAIDDGIGTNRGEGSRELEETSGRGVREDEEPSEKWEKIGHGGVFLRKSISSLIILMPSIIILLAMA